MMRKLLALTLVVVVLLAMVGCSASDEGKPIETVKSYFDAMAAGDLDSASELTTNPSANAKDFVFATRPEEEIAFVLATYSTITYEIGEELIDEKMATVVVTVTVADFPTIYPLAQEEVVRQYTETQEITTENMAEKSVEIMVNALKAADAPTYVSTVNASLIKNEEGSWKLDINQEFSNAFNHFVMA